MDLLENLICFSSKGMYLILKIISKCPVNILEIRQNGEKGKAFYFFVKKKKEKERKEKKESFALLT